MTETQLAEIEARANAATAGPWTVYGDWDTLASPPLACPISSDLAVATCESKHVLAHIHAPIGVITDRRETNEFGNSYFIAHARIDIPALVAEVRRLGQRIHALEANTSKSVLKRLDTQLNR